MTGEAKGRHVGDGWHRVATTGVAALLLAAIAAGVFLRFENLTTNGIRGSDTVYYTNLAHSWSEGDFATRVGDGVVAYRPVVYAVYALGIKALGFHDWTIKVVNATVDSLNIGLVFLLGYWLGRRDLVLSLVAAASYAVLPAAILLAREELVHVTSTFMLLSCSVLFVRAVGFEPGGRRRVLLLLSGILCAFVGLTHEELVLCAAGFGGVLLWDGLSRPGAKIRWDVAGDCVLFGVPVVLVAFQLYLVSEGTVASLLGAVDQRAFAERSLDYLARLFRFSWNGVVGTTSVVAAYACFALLLSCIAGLVRGGRWREASLGWASPIDALPWAVVAGYLVLYAYLFTTVLFERTFFPMTALVVVGLSVGWGQLLGRWFTPRIGRAVVLAAAIGIVPFNLDQFASFFAEGSKRWYAGPFPTELSPQAGVERLRAWSRSVQPSRWLYDAMGPHVSSDARLLIASSLMSPYPGRRVYQLGYYFGDDAIYAIDHTEPLDELIDAYRVKFVMVSDFRLDSRVLEFEDYSAYEYGGSWSERRPLRLGASYGFAPDEYSMQREAAFIHEYMMQRGARLLTSDSHTRVYGLGASGLGASGL